MNELSIVTQKNENVQNLKKYCNTQVHRLWIMAFTTLTFLWIGSWIFFPSEMGYGNPISTLGQYYTSEGVENPISMVLFVLSMGIVSFCFLVSALHFYKDGHEILSALSFLGFVGALLTALPLDVFRTLHSVGAYMWIFCLCLFIGLIFFRSRFFMNRYVFTTMVVFFFGIILLYIVFNILYITPQKEIVQKIFISTLISYSIILSLFSVKKWCNKDSFNYSLIKTKKQCTMAGGTWKNNKCN